MEETTLSETISLPNANKRFLASSDGTEQEICVLDMTQDCFWEWPDCGIPQTNEKGI